MYCQGPMCWGVPILLAARMIHPHPIHGCYFFGSLLKLSTPQKGTVQSCCLAFTIPNETVRFSSNSHSIYVCVSKNRGILRSVQLPPIEWLFHWVILSYEVWDAPKYRWLWLGLQGWQFLVWWERGPRLSRTDETNTTLFPTQQTVTNYLLVFCLCPLSPTLQFTRLA